MRHSAPFVAIALMLLPRIAAAGDNELSLSTLPTLSIPLGPVVDEDLPLFGLGGGASLRATLVPSNLPRLFARAAISLEILPVNGSAESFSLMTLGVNAGLNVSPLSRLSLRLSAGGGLYLASADLGSVRNPYAEAALDASLRMTPTLALEIGMSLRDLFTPTGSLYQGINLGLGLSWDLAGSRKGTEFRIDSILQQIYPLFYSYYDTHEAGSVRIVNTAGAPYEHLKVSFNVRQYMDSPKLCGELEKLPGGESASFPVYALFTDAIFKVTEGTKTAGEILIEYYYMGDRRTVTWPVTVSIQNRNAMTWDDDRKAAAFITAKDPLILAFAKNVASTVRYEGEPPVSEDFRAAFSLFETLRLYGIGYAVDPKTPYTALSEKEENVDFLQFPKQTLAYRGGDCDDLSVLYAALLEAVGVEAALVTTPGHIYVAFNAQIDEKEARKLFLGTSDVQWRGGDTWIPVEVTLVKEGFVRAWKKGAQEWREAERTGEVGFYPVREAWKLYEPVGFIEDTIPISIPLPADLKAAYQRELLRFQDSIVAPRIALQEKDDRDTRSNPEKAANRLGVLYAKFGLLSRAEEAFRRSVQLKPTAAALTNLGNALYLRGDMGGAAAEFGKALKISPRSASALSGSARALYALEDYQGTKEAMAVLESVSPELAKALDLAGEKVTTERASQSDRREVSTWDD